LDLKECGWCRNLGNDYQIMQPRCPDGSNDHCHVIFHGFLFGQALYCSHHCNRTRGHSLFALAIFIMLRTLLHSGLDAEFVSELTLALGKNK
jgi:hypothetical protein